ncbi:MAG: STAS domain-containing protein [Gammaproteobacteria bacterium]
MSSLRVTEKEAGVYSIAGEMTFTTVNRKTLKLFSFLRNIHDVTLDLGQVTAADSAGLALMVEWLKIAHRHKTKLRLKNLPEQLSALARLGGLNETLMQAEINLSEQPV